MSFDINNILSSWPFKPGEINVRRIVGDDGREKIQLRLDLGILQMETTGRPDGEKPHGHSSLLAYYEHLLKRHIKEYGSQEGFELDEQDCELLRSEGVMYYHRYLAEFVLGDYAAVERDTKRNLRMFDFCGLHVAKEHDQCACEQYRPYVLMMYARARSRRALKQARPKEALAVIQQTIREIQAIYDRFEQQANETSMELTVLHALAREIQTLIPADPRTLLRKKLQQAIVEERYEDAAAIRDRLGQAENTGKSSFQ